jgi:hypothetical protein
MSYVSPSSQEGQKDIQTKDVGTIPFNERRQNVLNCSQSVAVFDLLRSRKALFLIGPRNKESNFLIFPNEMKDF